MSHEEAWRTWYPVSASELDEVEAKRARLLELKARFLEQRRKPKRRKPKKAGEGRGVSMSDCEYCGTTLDEDGNNATDGSHHFVAQCREYVFAALRSYKRELIAEREARKTAEGERDAAASVLGVVCVAATIRFDETMVGPYADHAAVRAVLEATIDAWRSALAKS